MGLILYFTVVFPVVIALVFYFLKNKYSYWAKRGVPFIEPKFGLGNFKTDGTHHSVMIKELYDKLKGKSPIAGIYILFSPAVLVMDLDLIRTITVTDFNYFYNRGFYYNEKTDPLSVHLFNLEDETWKKMRQKLTPTFTSGKMKYMYPTILAVAERFEKLLNETAAENGGRFEPREPFARFTTDIIATCAFGLETNCLENPESEFRKMGALAFSLDQTVLFLKNHFRKTSTFLNLKLFPKQATDFFKNVVAETIDFRQKNNVTRKDFLQLLLDIRKQDKSDGVVTFTDVEIAAQAFVFFLAGFETSSTTLAYCAYYLAKNPQMQEKLREHIKVIVEKHNGDFTYEAMSEMYYLEQFINETLRISPALPNHWRVASKDYPVPGTNYVIEKGTQIWIPAYAIQRDPEYYPNPEVFDPERFSPENVHRRHPMTFTSFGSGPHLCIGERFGRMQIRVTLVTLLKNFRLKATSKTPEKLSYMPGFALVPQSEMHLRIEKL